MRRFAWRQSEQETGARAALQGTGLGAALSGLRALHRPGRAPWGRDVVSGQPTPTYPWLNLHPPERPWAPSHPSSIQPPSRAVSSWPRTDPARSCCEVTRGQQAQGDGRVSAQLLAAPRTPPCPPGPLAAFRPGAGCQQPRRIRPSAGCSACLFFRLP